MAGQARRRLQETERKLLTHAIWMSAYNSEGTLVRLPRSLYGRGDDEARALLREAFTLSGDLQITGDTLHVRPGRTLHRTHRHRDPLTPAPT